MNFKQLHTISVKAGSMAYAIFICVIIALLCFGFVLLGSSNHLWLTYSMSRDDVFRTNNAAEAYFVANAAQLHNQSQEKLFFDREITSLGEVVPWGGFSILKTKSYFKQDTVQSYALIGQKTGKLSTLYLPDNGKELHLTGKASIRGEISVPGAIVKQGYITTNAFKPVDFKGGKASKSSARLPKARSINSQGAVDSENSIPWKNTAGGFRKSQSFDKATLEIEITTSKLTNTFLSGNIIIKSKDSLFVSKNCMLRDIIIEAPVVTFESNFSGAVQVFTKRGVYLENSATLSYPSALFITPDKDEETIIYLDKGSSLIGGIALIDADYVGNSKRKLTVDTEALVVGSVYMNGSSDIKGRVVGSLYTDRLYLKTAAATYTNYLKDGQIDGLNLPDDFIHIPLFSTNLNAEYAIIKTL